MTIHKFKRKKIVPQKVQVTEFPEMDFKNNCDKHALSKQKKKNAAHN